MICWKNLKIIHFNILTFVCSKFYQRTVQEKYDKQVYYDFKNKIFILNKKNKIWFKFPSFVKFQISSTFYLRHLISLRCQ